MINIAMFKRIAEQIEAHPEMHDQYDYQGSSECGTTYCVAGWAIHLWGVDNGLDPEMRDFDVRQVYTEQKYGESFPLNPSEMGQEVLGLTYDQRCDLFYNMDNEDALRMVKEYAAGKTDVHSNANETGCECPFCA